MNEYRKQDSHLHHYHPHRPRQHHLNMGRAHNYNIIIVVIGRHMATLARNSCNNLK